MLGLLIVVGANTWVLHSGGPRYDRVEDVPVRPVAIAFGAGIDGDRPSHGTGTITLPAVLVLGAEAPPVRSPGQELVLPGG